VVAVVLVNLALVVEVRVVIEPQLLYQLHLATPLSLLEEVAQAELVMQ
jgi:hypothetical protein